MVLSSVHHPLSSPPWRKPFTVQHHSLSHHYILQTIWAETTRIMLENIALMPNYSGRLEQEWVQIPLQAWIAQQQALVLVSTILDRHQRG